MTIDAPHPAWWRLGPGLWFASVLTLIAAYLFFNLPGNWFGGGAPQSYPGAAMEIATGIGQVVDGKLVITASDSKNAVIVVLNTPRILTREYGLIALDVDGLPDDADVTLFWRNDLAPTKMFTRSLTVAGGRVQDAILSGDSNWLGRVHTVGLIVRSALAQPLTISSIALQPASAATILGARWRDWVDQETWTGISLSRVVGGRSGMDLPLPLLAGLAATLGCGAYWGLRRWRGWASSALTLGAVLMSGWLVLDLRWQWNLGLDVIASMNSFAGKDLSSKRLAGIDAELERIAVDIRPLLTPDARLFVVAEASVVAGRLAYLLLPAKIHYDIAQGSLPSPGQFRTGDLVLVHRKPGIRYSPERKEFLWDRSLRVRAEILYAKQGTVLARVL
jgi:hypothetical protein